VTQPRPAAVVVLAAGSGTRMKSKTMKVLHPVCGRSMIGHVVTAALAVRDDHRAGARLRRQRLPGDPDGVTGALLRLLHRQDDARHQLLDVRADLLALVTDDRDDPARLQGTCGPQDVADHGPPGDRVEHLHRLGLHPGAATGGEDDHGHVVGHTAPP
jgi:hypothetical protein